MTKLSALVEEVNQEQELLQLCEKLCDDLLTEHRKQFPTLTEYSYSYKVSRKYIKIISFSGNQQSVWGFINKGNKKFQVGDLLKAAGRNAPATNKARGNIFETYSVAWTGPHYLK